MVHRILLKNILFLSFVLFLAGCAHDADTGATHPGEGSVKKVGENQGISVTKFFIPDKADRSAKQTPGITDPEYQEYLEWKRWQEYKRFQEWKRKQGEDGADSGAESSHATPE